MHIDMIQGREFAVLGYEGYSRERAKLLHLCTSSELLWHWCLASFSTDHVEAHGLTALHDTIIH